MPKQVSNTTEKYIKQKFEREFEIVVRDMYSAEQEATEGLVDKLGD